MTINNATALEILEEYTTAASTAVQASVWASAFLTEGGEATYDAVKSVSFSADLLVDVAEKVKGLVDNYGEIAPF